MTGAMTLLGRMTLGLTLAATSVLLPGTAWAITVDCSNEDGSCTVSNDGGTDFQSCSCAGGSGTTGAGGNEYAGLDAEALAQVCEGLLELCAPIESDVGTDTFPMTTSVGTVSDTEGDTSDSFGTTDPTDATGSATTDHSTSDPTDASTTDHDTSGHASGSTSGDTEGTTGDGTTGDGTTGDGTTGDGTTTNAQPTATDPTMPSDDASAEDSSGGEAGGAEGESSGCGCTAGPGDPAALLGLFALLGLRRRRGC